MIIDRIEAIPLSIPFKPGDKSGAAAWGDKGLPTADSLLVKVIAAIHATAALGSADSMIEWRDFNLEAQLYGGALQPADGHVPVPAGPGLGLEPDEEVISAYAARPT